MTSGRSSKAARAPKYILPTRFADYLSYHQGYCLLLDIDGTLAEFTLNPKDSIIPPSTLRLLQTIQHHGVKIAAVTGRSLAEAKQMLSPLRLPIAATHGLEIAFDEDNLGNLQNSNIGDDSSNQPSNVAVDLIELAAIRQAIYQSCLPYDDFIIENKPYSVALHYRQNPALADIAQNIVSTVANNYDHWLLKQGKYVWEIAPKGADKGRAILTLLQNMQSLDALCPIFIGDDITDESGFMAVQGDNHLKDINTAKKSPIKGMGIKVENNCATPTAAHYYVNDIDEVTALLASFLAFCQTRSAVLPKLADTGDMMINQPMRPVI